MERNRHHIWWEHREYKRNHVLTALRSHRGFIIPARVIDHRDLHHNLNPGPPKPTREQAIELLDSLGEFQPMRGRLSAVFFAIEYFNEAAYQEGPTSRNAREIAQHLQTQVHFLSRPWETAQYECESQMDRS